MVINWIAVWKISNGEADLLPVDKEKVLVKPDIQAYIRRKKKYRAIITINNKTVHIGMFDTAEDAALAYNKRAAEVYGSEAKLNVIREAANS